MKLLKVLGVIFGILLIGAGVYLLFTPDFLADHIGLIFAVAMLVKGVFSIVRFFVRKAEEADGWLLAGGILSGALGIFLLANDFAQFIAHGLLGTFIIISVMVWLFVTGIFHIVDAFRVRKLAQQLGGGYEGSGWGWFLALGILQIVLGIVALSNPLGSTLGIMIAMNVIAAITLIGTGANTITATSIIR